MSRIPPELLKKIKDATHLLELVGEHVVLRKVGANYVGLCPFHSERTPSFSVHEVKQLYHCYGCKKGGDSVSFVMEILGLSFAQAIEELAERAKIPLVGFRAQGSEQLSAQQQKIALAFKLNRFALVHFQQNLKTEGLFQRYLRQRQVPQTQVDRFFLGAALDDWGELTDYFAKSKAPLDLALEIGLVRAHKRLALAVESLPETLPVPKSAQEQLKDCYDHFRGRIIFPILNLRGKIAGFGGRALTGDVHPKYLNSPESLIFHKSQLVFGLYQAQKMIREKDELLLVEGYFDVLALSVHGFEHAVATCGTALSVDHLKLLRRFSENIIVLFDGDSAGQAATERAMEVGLEQGIVLRGAHLPAGLDPDEFLAQKDGAFQLQQLLAQAQPLLDHKIEAQVQIILKSYGQSDGQGFGLSSEHAVQALKQIKGWLSRLQDPIGSKVRWQQVAKRLGLSEELMRELRQGQGVQKILPKPAPSQAQFAASYPSAVLTLPVPARHLHSPLHSPQAPQAPPHPGGDGDGGGGGVARGEATRWGGARRRGKLGASDRILLQGLLADTQQVAAHWQEVVAQMPPELSWTALWEDAFLRHWVQSLFPAGFRTEEQASVLERLDFEMIEDLEIRALVSAAAMKSELVQEEFKRALHRALHRLWRQVAQAIRKEIAQAERARQLEWQAKKMKDYLDVQRKINDLKQLYDEE